MTLTPDELSEIRARCEAATEGPWIAYADSCAECARQKTSEWNVNGLESGYHGQIDKEADALFIAHSRSDIPALLSTITTLEQQLAELADLAADSIKTVRQTSRKLALEEAAKALNKIPTMDEHFHAYYQTGYGAGIADATAAIHALITQPKGA